MKKKCKVVMLPTEKASKLIKYIDGVSELQFREATIGWTHSHGLHIEPQHLYLISDDESIKEDDWIYIIKTVLNSKKVDRYLEGMFERTGLKKGIHYFKVIASTDPELGYYKQTETQIAKYMTMLPRIPESFIKAYVKANGIDEVMVEYAMYDKKTNKPWLCVWNLGLAYWRLKLTDNNEVILEYGNIRSFTIPPIEKMYSKEDVVELLKSLSDEVNSEANCGGMSEKDINKWIEENL